MRRKLIGIVCMVTLILAANLFSNAPASAATTDPPKALHFMVKGVPHQQANGTVMYSAVAYGGWDFWGEWQDGCCGNIRYKFAEYAQWFTDGNGNISAFGEWCGRTGGWFHYDGCKYATTLGGYPTIRVFTDWTFDSGCCPLYVYYTYPRTDITFVNDGWIYGTVWTR